MIKRIIYLLFFIIALGACSSCVKNYSREQREYISLIKKLREEKNISFEKEDDSPFNHKSKVHFEPLKYYEVDPGFVFKSRLVEYPEKDTLKVYGTKGEERKAVRYGYVKFNYEKKEYKLNVYQGFTKDKQEYYSIWFTDQTTGNETYGVGRYLDFELKAQPDYIYTIDFNLSYNPYCAYSPEYSCAVPLKEDHIDLAVKAGEKKFH